MPTATLQAGKLRQRIQIVQPSLVQDSFGGTVIDDAPGLVTTTWASVEALLGRELYNAQQIVSQVTHKVTIRWQAGIKAKQNVWFDSRELQIQAVLNPDERHHMLVLLCIERDDSAREGAGGTSGAVTTTISGGLQRVVFTGDGATRVFTLPSSPAGDVGVYRNGVLQTPPGDYSRNGTVITMVVAPAVGDTIAALY